MLQDLFQSNDADLNVVTVRNRLQYMDTEETYYHTLKSETNISVCLWPGITSKFGLSQHMRTVHDGIVLVCDVKGCLLTGSAKEQMKAQGSAPDLQLHRTQIVHC